MMIWPLSSSAHIYMRTRHRARTRLFIVFLLLLCLYAITNLLYLQSSQDYVEVSSQQNGVEDSPASDDFWQTVGGTKYKFRVYSAFYENRRVKQIRLIGATKTHGGNKEVWCRFWFYGNHSIDVRGKVKMIRENWNLKYSACFITCPIGRNHTIPQSVSILAHPKGNVTNVLRVLYTQGLETPHKDSMAVCIKPLHYYYNRHLELIEFIEFNMILGATHFIMYNHTVGQQVDCILRHYQSKRLLTILPWQLDMVSQKEIRTEGIFASLNDCLYRSMYRYTYTAFLDFDEYVIPRHHETLPKMMAHLSVNRSSSKAIGAFSFQNAFFYLQWKDEPMTAGDSIISASLVTQRKTRRSVILHRHEIRSKYICMPERVMEVGNHFIWEFIPRNKHFHVSPEDAILHHYRVCEFGGNDCVNSSSIIDRTAWKYKQTLSTRVNDVYQEIKAICSLPEIKKRSDIIFWS